MTSINPAFLILLFAVLVVPVFGQLENIKISPDEIQAAKVVGERFETRLDQSGDITPLISEMFVSDHVARFVKEAKAQLTTNGLKPKSVVFASGIFYDPELLNTASEEDWRQLYIQSFNFMRYSTGVMMNLMADTMISGKDTDEELEAAFDRAHPPAVTKLFDNHPILRNFLRKEEDTSTITTVSELQSVAHTLNEANNILRKDPLRSKLTASAHTLLTMLKEKKGKDKFGPSLEITKREAYGFPGATRLILFFPSPMHHLIIAKVGNEYKIVDARIASPD